MTEQTQPTDAEIDALAREHKTGPLFFGNPTFDVHSFARAVLAKWGTPAGAGWRINFPAQEPLGEPFQRVLDENRWELYAGADSPQPTQAQAGAVPLTRYRVLEPRVDRIEADDEYLQDDAQTWATDPNGTFVGTIYGYALRAARRRIKGADHA